MSVSDEEKTPEKHPIKRAKYNKKKVEKKEKEILASAFHEDVEHVFKFIEM